MSIPDSIEVHSQMSYVCNGCGARVNSIVWVCHNCQRWAQHVEQLTRELEEARAMLRRLAKDGRLWVDDRDVQNARVQVRYTDLSRALLRKLEWRPHRK